MSGKVVQMSDRLRAELNGSPVPDDPGEDTASASGGLPPFIHLHVRSAYSLLEGALPLPTLLKRVQDHGQPAVAVTDRSNLFGALEFSQKAKGMGVQPIVGCTLEVALEEEASDAKPWAAGRGAMVPHPVMVFLAASERGYENLTRLVSLAYLENGSGSRVHVTARHLADHGEGLIALTGGPDGPLNRALAEGQAALADERLDGLQRVFGDRLYIELQRHEGYDRAVEDALIERAYARDLPLVATNEAYFPCADDHEAHDALVCIAESRLVIEEDRRRLTRDHCLKSSREMHALFADLPEAVENTFEIAQRCAFGVGTRDPILPYFTGGEGEDPLAAEAAELKRQAREGLARRLNAEGFEMSAERAAYEERLEFELGVIERMQYPGYFLIVADFIQWAKDQGIPVGPGRGSGAGSVVAWALTITDLDPLRFSLLFERFLNPDRVSMPDFDIDFCQDRRDEVIRYVQERYGRAQVAQIITFGTLQARAVLRDVGRVLQMPFGQVDRLCKMVPNNPANPTTLPEALKSVPDLADARRSDRDVDRLITIALKLEGLYRHASTHAAGIVIGDRALEQLVPMYRDPRSDMPVTQYNMKWVEQAGLVKFDFLGLKTLTVIHRTLGYLRQRSVEVDIDGLPLTDEPTYAMLTRGETVGVFQLESAGMRKALIGMKPDAFEDIIALVALYRPGPMENIPVYNARKHGQEKPDFYDERIEHVLKETQGVIIYQEQVMQIAQILSGYSLGEADLLRRAMGKKIRSEMEKQRTRFVDGAVERGMKPERADYIFDVLAKFADYGFNKSHAAAYALISYQTAWLKANHPVEFMAALMTLDMDKTDKLADFYRETKRAGIEVVPPSVNTSEVEFAVADGRIFYALAAIKGVGAGAVEHIVQERRANGPFADYTDFFGRIDARQINRKMLENLIHAGALDCFGVARERLIAGLDRLMGHAARVAQDDAMGITDMFGGGGDGSGAAPAVDLPEAKAWTAGERLTAEFSAVGFYLSAHPLDEYAELLKGLRVQSYADFAKGVRLGATHGQLAGTVTGFQQRKTRTGNPMGIVMFSDPTGQFEAVLFAEQLTAVREKLEVGASLILNVGAEDRPEGPNIRVASVRPLEEAASDVKQRMQVYLRDDRPLNSIASILKRGGKGQVDLILLHERGEREVTIELPGARIVSPQVAGAIKAVDGVVDVALV